MGPHVRRQLGRQFAHPLVFVGAVLLGTVFLLLHVQGQQSPQCGDYQFGPPCSECTCYPACCPYACDQVVPCTGITAPTNGGLGTCPGGDMRFKSSAYCSFTCNPGYTLSGGNSGGNSSCCAGTFFAQTCEPSPCSLAPPIHGALGNCPRSLASGASCSFSCSEGYTLSETATSCSLGVASLQVCKPNACTVVPPFNGALGQCSPSLASGDSCRLSCDTGYTLSVSGPASTTCMAGTLTPQTCAPSCAVVPPNNGLLYRCPTSLASGSTCQFACDSGYTLTGAATSCSDGALTAQQCQPICSVAPPANGAYNNCPTSLASGASCSIVCNHGYVLVGSETFCSNGALVAQACQGAPCPVVAPTNGALNGCPASLPSGSSCTFSCNNRYTLSETSTSCLAGVLTAQTCLTPEEIAAANAARTASGQSTASGLPPGVQEALISIASALGAAAAAFGGWYWKRSNDARKRAQRRALAAAIFEHLPFVDADAFDSPTGQEFIDAVDALARRVGQVYPKLMHGLLINHPRLPLPQLEELGRAISVSARAAGLELNAPTMPAVVACIFRCQQFKGALVTHFADEHMQQAIVVALATTLENDRMQAALRALAVKLQAQVTRDAGEAWGAAAAASPFEGVEVELTAGMPSSDA